MHRTSSAFSVVRRALAPLALAAATLALSGCSAVRTIAGVNTVALQQARVDAMEVEIGTGARVICPRQPLQMHVAVSAQLPGQAAPATYDTWRGVPGMRRNGKLDFANFAFSSDQGRFDEWGWFEPNPDILATVDSGFTIVTELLHPSAGLSDRRHYDADYSCIVSAGVPGAPGRGGTDGSSGASGGSGGSGNTFDWKRIPVGVQKPFVLAGGITPDNVFEAILATLPWGVDVSSGIESAPGLKDGDKMRQFVEEVRRADCHVE